MASPTTTDRSSLLTLGPGAPDVRRAVGPTAWVVLECLAATAINRASETVSHESVRGIAVALGLAKDTVARALQRLQRAGFVCRIDERLTDGRFGHSRYVLVIPSDVVNLRPAHQTPTISPRTTTKPSHRPEQLALLDDLIGTRP